MIMEYPYERDLDERDRAILDQRRAARLRIDSERPLTGDVIRFADGSRGRVAHVWEDSVQWSRDGSCYLAESGGMAYSGGLEPGVPMERFSPTVDYVPASCWFFHHDRRRAHNGVNVTALVRLWECDEIPR